MSNLTKIQAYRDIKSWNEIWLSIKFLQSHIEVVISDSILYTVNSYTVKIGDISKADFLKKILLSYKVKMAGVQTNALFELLRFIQDSPRHNMLKEFIVFIINNTHRVGEPATSDIPED